MKKQILAGLLSLSLLSTNIGTYAYYDDKLIVAQKTISTLQTESKTKSTEIARLEGVIKSKDQKLEQQQKVIDNQKSIANKQKAEIDRLNKAIQEEKKKQKSNFNVGKKGDDGGRKIHVEATAYIAHCTEGCTGTTATGVNVSNSIYYKGHRVIAVDTSVIPLNSLVKVDINGQSFTAMAIDTGGGIDSNEIDLLVENTNKAIEFGRQQATITILKKGD